jgi:hypothetical protein
LLDGGLLFYVYLFALRQTHSRQSAWFQSFVMWLLFEVTVSSTGLVLLTHLLVPLFVMTDVSRLKEKVLRDLIKFRDNYLTNSLDIEEGGAGGEDEGVEGLKTFNAAKYLFPSWQLAVLFPELPESGLILQFSTPWPKRKLGETGGAVSTEYEQDTIIGALSRILLYFLGSLLRFHALIQDIFLQTICNSGLGLLAVWMIHLFAIHPALPVAMGLSLLLALSWLLRLSSRKVTERLVTVPTELHDPPPLPSSPVLAGGGGHLRERPLSVASNQSQELSSTPSLQVDFLSTGERAISPLAEHSSITRANLSSASIESGSEEQCMWSQEEGSDGEGAAESSDSDDSNPSASSDSSDMVQVVIVPRTRRVRR